MQTYPYTIAINGTNFTEFTELSIGGQGVSGIDVKSITVFSPTQLVANIDLKNAAPIGSTDVTVTTPGIGSYTLTSGFEVVADAVVDFPDPNLEAVIRTAIPKPSGAINQSDLWDVKTVIANGCNIQNLSGLEYCQTLNVLVLSDNQISDISLLISFDKLQLLKLDNNQISDISPLVGLSKVSELVLGLSANQISDISPLAGSFTGLSKVEVLSLDLSDNQISDISPLADLEKVYPKNIDLSGNQISDISALTGFTTLMQLILSDNEIVDLTPLVSLYSLINLDLDGNQISDIQPLVDNYYPLNDEGERGLDDGDYVDLQYNPLSSEAINTDIPALEARGVIVNPGSEQLTPIVASLSPSEGTQGETLSVFIIGVNFIYANLVSFNGSGITLNGYDINSDNLITANITIDDAATTGSGDVSVATPLATDTLTGGFTVIAVPVVTDIPDQTIDEGGSFATINLDDYVSDADNTDDEITWTYSDNSELTVSIDSNRVATIGTPADWSGAETITFTATDPALLSDSDAATFTVTQNSTTVVLYATADSRVAAQTPTTNYGTETRFIVQAKNTSGRQRGLIQFDLSGIPAGSTINSATFSSYYYSYTLASFDPEGRTYYLYQNTEPWTETGVTWNNQPGYTTSQEASTAMPSSFGWVDWDVTGIVQTWVDGTDNYGFVMRDSNEIPGTNKVAQFYSREYGSNAPTLEISYTSGAAPSGSYILSITTDGNGSTTPPEGVYMYSEGTVVDITANPDTGWAFVDWTGDVADPDSPSTTVTMDGNKTVTANFADSVELTLYSTADSRIVLQDPNANKGTETSFIVQANGTDGRQRGLIKFDLASIPVGSTVNSATFSAYKDFLPLYYVLPGSNPTGRTYDLYRNTEPWTETGVTWNNQPGYETTQEASAVMPYGFKWVDWDVTSIVQTWVNGYANYGFTMMDSDEIGGIQEVGGFRSKEFDGGGYAPTLEISYTPGPIPPSYTLTVTTNGSGSVSIYPDYETYYEGTLIELTATSADPSWGFTGWSGDLSGSTNPVIVAMDADKNITATFTELDGLTLYSIKDSKIVAQDPDSNKGTEDYLVVQSNIVDGRQRGLIQFDLTGIPADATIYSATFSAYYSGYVLPEYNPAGRTYYLRRITEDWTETGVTWNNQPGYETLQQTSVVVPESFSWVDWDATGIVQTWWDGTATNYGFMMMDSNEITGFNRVASFYSREYDGGSYTPALQIFYLSPP